MNESKNNLTRIAMNLTKTEYAGYCKGMSLEWTFLALEDKTSSVRAGKKLKFWDRAYDKYSHNCKDGE